MALVEQPDGSGGGGSSAVKFKQGYVSGQYHACTLGSVQGGLGNPTLNRTHFTPFRVEVAQAFDRIATYITVNGTATAVDRLGVYNDTAGVPSTVLFDAGTVAVDAGAAAIKAITISQTLQPGVYWAACCGQTAGTAQHQRAVADTYIPVLNTVFSACQYYSDDFAGAFGNNPTLFSAAIAPPVVALRAV